MAQSECAMSGEPTCYSGMVTDRTTYTPQVRTQTHCYDCGKLLPNQPIWMVIEPGTEHLYFCQCNNPWRYAPPYQRDYYGGWDDCDCCCRHCRCKWHRPFHRPCYTPMVWSSGNTYTVTSVSYS